MLRLPRRVVYETSKAKAKTEEELRLPRRRRAVALFLGLGSAIAGKLRCLRDLRPSPAKGTRPPSPQLSEFRAPRFFHKAVTPTSH